MHAYIHACRQSADGPPPLWDSDSPVPSPNRSTDEGSLTRTLSLGLRSSISDASAPEPSEGSGQGGIQPTQSPVFRNAAFPSTAACRAKYWADRRGRVWDWHSPESPDANFSAPSFAELRQMYLAEQRRMNGTFCSLRSRRNPERTMCMYINIYIYKYIYRYI